MRELKCSGLSPFHLCEFFRDATEDELMITVLFVIFALFLFSVIVPCLMLKRT